MFAPPFNPGSALSISSRGERRRHLPSGATAKRLRSYLVLPGLGRCAWPLRALLRTEPPAILRMDSEFHLDEPPILVGYRLSRLYVCTIQTR